jgi:hypothetical protein
MKKKDMNQQNSILNFNQNELVVKTNGKGFWSKKSVLVEIKKIELIVATSETFVFVYWAPNAWDIEEDGLIYTDSYFKQDLKKQLSILHPEINWGSLSYTEQGMQGLEYVHMILGCW